MQQDVADVAKPDQQPVVEKTPHEAGIATDKSDPRVSMVDEGSPVGPAKSAKAEQDSAVATRTPQQPGTATVNEEAAGPARMASGMMKDPLKTMSGMMQNPAQTMSGMMNPAAPGSSGVSKDSENTQTQTLAPEASTGQRQIAEGHAPAYRPQMSAPPPPLPPVTATGQQAEIPPQQQYYQIINKARHAYWQGQYQQSVEDYQQAIELMPESPDGHGELGNVYYAQGEWDKAGESLYQAAIRLLDKGRSDKANNMLSIIRGLRHERAMELEKRLQTQRSRQ